MVDGKCNSTFIKLWKQTVTIMPNTYYLFSIWISSLKNNLEHSGILLFNIGGQSIFSNINAPYKGGATPDNAGGGWIHYEKIWFSDTICGPILISIENNNTETCESEVDFGIDDIELKPVHKENIANATTIKKRDNILFATASDHIDSIYFNYLNQLAKELLKNSTLKLYVKGYTDDRDAFESNLDLLKRRSISVRNYLRSKGIPSDRINTGGFSETLPVETNGTIEGRKQNKSV